MTSDKDFTLTPKTDSAEILELLKQQGIYDLDTLVKKTLEAAPQALGLAASSHGCCFICSPTGHGYCYVVLEQ